MKRIKLSVFALIPVLCFGAANDIRVSQKNSTDSGWIDRIFSPASGTTFSNALGLTNALGVPQSINYVSNGYSDAIVNLTFDTDIGEDADDIGAMAVLHRLADLGEVNILAMAYVGTHSYGAQDIAALNTFYGRPNIPVGTGTSVYVGTDYYGTFLAAFPQRIGTTTPPSAVKVYRKTLASAPDSSVTMVFSGQMSNLSALYYSTADSISPLTGSQLISQKVAAIEILGGIYPSGSEHDFITDPVAAQVINYLPSSVPVYFLGYECGVNVLTKSNQPKYSAVRASYDQFFSVFGGSTRSSWGAMQIVHAVRGLSSGATTYFTQSSPGTNVIAVDGSNSFSTATPNKGQRYLIQSLSNSDFATALQAIMDPLPLQTVRAGVLSSNGYLINAPLNITPTIRSQLNMWRGTSLYGVFGIDDGNDIVTGAGDGDWVWRAESGIYDFSAPGGTSVKLRVDASGLTGATISTPVAGQNLVLSAGSGGTVNVNGVAFPASPSTNTVPVVTSANTITYERVPNAALGNASVTIGNTTVQLGTTATTIANVTLTSATVGASTMYSSGRGGVGTSTAISDEIFAVLASTTTGLQVKNTSSAANVMTLFSSTASGDNIFAGFYTDGGTQRGGITYNRGANTTSFNTTSDARLKTNIRPLVGSGNIIDALQPHVFDWKDGPRNSVGFVAQELYRVYPQAVFKGDDDPLVVHTQWAVDNSKLVPVIVADMQAMKRVNYLSLYLGVAAVLLSTMALIAAKKKP